MEKILTKKKPEKKLLVSLGERGGRGSSGRITVRHRGGGVKRLYRMVDFGQEKIDIPGKVIAIEYDPYRSAFIALIQYQDNEKRYILAPKDLEIGQEIVVSEKTSLASGNRLKLKNISIGTLVYNIEMEPGKGGKLVRGAGSAARVLGQERKYILLEMPSSEIRRLSGECFASVGTVSNPEHIYRVTRKAGRSRLKGRRPTVRGSAMIPPDHPHGGGEGKAPIGLKHPKTPWGKPAFGVKTRKRKKWTNKFIVQRRKKK